MTSFDATHVARQRQPPALTGLADNNLLLRRWQLAYDCDARQQSMAQRLEGAGAKADFLPSLLRSRMRFSTIPTANPLYCGAKNRNSPMVSNASGRSTTSASASARRSHSPDGPVV